MSGPDPTPEEVKEAERILCITEDSMRNDRWVDQAYRTLSLKLHPDKAKDDDEREKKDEQFKALSDAKDTLQKAYASVTAGLKAKMEAQYKRVYGTGSATSDNRTGADAGAGTDTSTQTGASRQAGAGVGRKAGSDYNPRNPNPRGEPPKGPNIRTNADFDKYPRRKEKSPRNHSGYRTHTDAHTRTGRDTRRRSSSDSDSAYYPKQENTSPRYEKFEGSRKGARKDTKTSGTDSRNYETHSRTRSGTGAGTRTGPDTDTNSSDADYVYFPPDENTAGHYVKLGGSRSGTRKGTDRKIKTSDSHPVNSRRNVPHGGTGSRTGTRMHKDPGIKKKTSKRSDSDSDTSRPREQCGGPRSGTGASTQGGAGKNNARKTSSHRSLSTGACHCDMCERSRITKPRRSMGNPASRPNSGVVNSSTNPHETSHYGYGAPMSQNMAPPDDVQPPIITSSKLYPGYSGLTEEQFKRPFERPNPKSRDYPIFRGEKMEAGPKDSGTGSYHSISRESYYKPKGG